VTRLFGTDGIRGKANVYPISPELALKLGQALGIYFKKHVGHPRILIGKDTRRSGYMLEQALGAGICSVGVDVQQLGPLPTPGIAYLTQGLRACAGVVISASHNPYEDNGIKIFSGDGFKLPDEVEDEIAELALSETLGQKLPTGMNIGRARRIDDAIGQYAVFLKESFPKQLSLEGLRIVIDCANGASYKVAPKVFEELGAEIFCIGTQPNGRNINDGCGALHPNNLASKVSLYKADLGFAFDGDADRLIVVDGRGEVIGGDQILAICGRHMIKHEKLSQKTVVSTVMSNGGLEASLKEVGGSLVRTQVGDRYVMEEMRKNNYNLGGEQSGHLIFKDYATTGDGILAALRLLEVCLLEQKPLEELAGCMTEFPQLLKTIPVDKKIPLENLPDLSKAIKSVEGAIGKTGRVLFRYSGTENAARIMLEGEDMAVLKSHIAELEDQTIKALRGK
jgi:phosphoglucosamine mutase